jgi:hypothetical protein
MEVFLSGSVAQQHTPAGITVREIASESYAPVTRPNPAGFAKKRLQTFISSLLLK